MNTRTKVTLLAASAMIATVALTATASAQCHSGPVTDRDIIEAFEITKQVNVLSGRNESTTTIASIINFLECNSKGMTHAGAVDSVTRFARALMEMKTDPDSFAKDISRKLPEGKLKENMRNWVDQVVAAPTMARALNLALELKDQMMDYNTTH
jgi:hypothetical protein